MANSTRSAAIRAAAKQANQPHAASPFDAQPLDAVRAQQKRQKLDGLTLTDASGQSHGDLFRHISVKVDGEPFVKWFAAGRAVRKLLSKPGALVLDYVEDALRPGNAVVYLDPVRFAATHSAPKATWYAGLAELLTFGLLAKSLVRGFYFVNHHMLFNGNRIARKTDFTLPKHQPTE